MRLCKPGTPFVSHVRTWAIKQQKFPIHTLVIYILNGKIMPYFLQNQVFIITRILNRRSLLPQQKAGVMVMFFHDAAFAA